MALEMENMWQAMKGSHYRRTIEKLTLSIRQTADLDEALQTALNEVETAIHAEAGTLWIYEDGRIWPRAVVGGGELAGISLLPGEGIAGQVIETGKSVIIKDCQADRRWAGRVDEKTGFTTKSMICVPLTMVKTGFGCIQIINNKMGQLFDEKDLFFTEQLGIEIVKLLKEKGLLDAYRGDEPEQKVPELSFRQLFVESDAKTLEKLLYTIPEFSALTSRKQREVVQLAESMRQCFEKRRGRFGF